LPPRVTRWSRAKLAATRSNAADVSGLDTPQRCQVALELETSLRGGLEVQTVGEEAQDLRRGPRDHRIRVLGRAGPRANRSVHGLDHHRLLAGPDLDRHGRHFWRAVDQVNLDRQREPVTAEVLLRDGPRHERTAPPTERL